jgi:protein-S-isoprenylcysteine O-methyltransferase Ste14
MKALDTLIWLTWAAFWVYWFVSAFGAKRSVTTNFGRFLGIRLIAFVVLATAYRTFIVRTNEQQSLIIVQQTNLAYIAIGFALVLAGLSFAVWARLHIGRNWGMPMTQRQDPQLVTSGPYRFVRHPIYTGLIVALLGNVLALGQYWVVALAIAAGYFVFSAHVEETHLAKIFPKDYPGYKKRTKMLIPFVF